MATAAAPKPPAVRASALPAIDATGGTRFGHVSIALLRLATGFIFLWAFLDKTFGLGYSTPSERAWINGGSPTNGFLSHLEAGPFKGFFNAIAGNWLTDALFMLGMLGVGVAVMLGAGLWIAAWSGTVIMLMMWVAEWPFARFTETGDPTGSTNPLVDYHIIYALALLVCAAYGAGKYFGIGGWWGSLSIVARNPWLK